MSDIAVGVPVFTRSDALREFLESVPEYVSTAYIADNGRTDERDYLYDRCWPFDLDVIDLDYDVGIGPCRHAIADRVDESYLWVGDNDMRFLRHDYLQILREILESDPVLGGVSAFLREGDTVRACARNLHQHGQTVVQSVREQPKMFSDPYPHAHFDLLPQAMLVRTAVFDDYTYDPELYNSEHIDFFLGHQNYDWEWAATPAVLVEHNKNIDPDYRENRGEDSSDDFAHIEQKFGVAQIVPGQRGEWRPSERSLDARLFDGIRAHLPPSVWIPIRKIAQGGERA